MALFYFRPTICRRISDNSLWKPSHPGYPTLWHDFHFVGIRKLRLIPGIWRVTGRTWQFREEHLFDVVALRPRKRRRLDLRPGGAWRFGPTICRRKIDGSLWMSSSPSEGDNRTGFYFVGAEPVRGLPLVWRENGSAWSFSDPKLFETVRRGR